MFQIVNDPVSGQKVFESKEYSLQVALLDIGKMSWQNAMDACENIGNSWVLPNSAELEIIQKELFLKGIGNINAGYYWSSIELSPNNAIYIRMND